MNAHVMMLLLASGLFSAMWSSDRATTPIPREIADHTKHLSHQSVPDISARSHEDPPGVNHAVASPTTGRILTPVTDTSPGVRVATHTGRPADRSINWTTSLFQKMAGSGRPLQTVQNELTNTIESAGSIIGDKSRRVLQGWLTAARESLQRPWERFHRSQELSHRARRTARQ